MFYRQGDKKKHYSYDYYSHHDFAEAYENDRFGTRFGSFLKQLESAQFWAMLNPECRNVLDIGTGTGKLAHFFASRGKHCIGLDASTEMIRQAMKFDSSHSRLRVDFVAGDAHMLPFADGCFDAVVGSRVLMHLIDWQRSVSEMCRVSHSTVILDFPSFYGLASIEASLRRVLTRVIKKRVQPYQVFRQRHIERVLHENGFRIVAVQKTFVLPVAVYRKLDSPRFAIAIENLLAAVGLRYLLGSPVIVRAIRKE